jgi:hypothetical protein
MRAVTVLTALLVSGAANASFVEVDWKTDGDALVTYDSRTNQSWLDLSETSGKSVNDVESLLSSAYLGWRLPTRDEVADLFATAMPDADNYPADFVSDTHPLGAQVRYFNHFLGESDVSTEDRPSDRSFGYFKSDAGDASLVGAGIYYSYSGYTQSANEDKLFIVSMSNDREYPTSLDGKSIYYGIFLVADESAHLTPGSQETIANERSAQSVSTPMVAGSLLLGLMGVGVRRNKKPA